MAGPKLIRMPESASYAGVKNVLLHTTVMSIVYVCYHTRLFHNGALVSDYYTFYQPIKKVILKKRKRARNRLRKPMVFVLVRDTSLFADERFNDELPVTF